ncbi:hypothetical protein K9M74_03780 [Candidatus Woesearchaeota archaeon]|nr:hypothetical protein [Candidatus Woesearchaeota archaeon]
MGVEIELLEQLKEATKAIQTVAEALTIKTDGSINVNELNPLQEIMLKDGSGAIYKARVNSDGRLLVDTNLVISPDAIITDPIDPNKKAKVNSSGRLLVETEQQGANDTIIVDPIDNDKKAKVDANGRLLVSATSGNGLLGSVKIEDATDSSKKVFVDASGRMLVALPPPSPPIGTTEVKQTKFNDVGGNSADYDYYIIPNGEIIRIQKLLGSSEDRAKESYVALWLDNNGEDATGSDGHVNWSLISIAFSNISNVNFDLNEEVTGDGTKRIVLHRRRMDAGARLVFARWQGYY